MTFLGLMFEFDANADANDLRTNVEEEFLGRGVIRIPIDEALIATVRDLIRIAEHHGLCEARIRFDGFDVWGIGEGPWVRDGQQLAVTRLDGWAVSFLTEGDFCSYLDYRSQAIPFNSLVALSQQTGNFAWERGDESASRVPGTPFWLSDDPADHTGKPLLGMSEEWL